MTIASSAAIIKEKEILLVKRSSYTSEFSGCWAFPGGRADTGETPEQNVIREVKEETGLEFTPKEIIKTGQYKERELYRFIGEWDGEIKIQEEEIVDYGWFTYDQCVELDLAFDYGEVIEILHRRGLI